MISEAVSARLGAGMAVLLARHGLLTVGDDLNQAYAVTLAAEFSARLLTMARSMGKVLTPMDGDEVAEMHAAYRRQYRAKHTQAGDG